MVREITTAGDQGSMQVVTFRVGSEEYGLHISAIAEVIRPLRVTPLPRMPEFVEGVINLRGTIIPVVDLRRRFALTAVPERSKQMRMLITRGALGARALLALVVDGVSEVLQVASGQVDRAPQAATGKGAEFISGMAKVGDRLIILIDLTKVLSRRERIALQEAGDAND